MSNVILPWLRTFLLLLGLAAKLEAGTVQTLDGRIYRGTIRLLPPDALSVSASEAVRVPLTNLLRADFSQPTNARPVRPSGNSRLVRADTDENRGALPEPWQHADVGKLMKPGASAHSRGIFTAEAHPQVKKAKGDALHFIYQPWQGDGEFVARVANVNPRDAKGKQARAGVMMRKGLEADSPNVSMFITGGLGSVFKRVSRKGTRLIDDNRPDLKPPYWVKLSRESGSIAGFHSTDGKNWKLVGSSATDLPDRILVGLAVASDRRSPAAGEFDHVSVQSIVPQSAFVPKIVLRDGTTIADRFISMDESSVVFSNDRRSLRVLTSDVSRILFQPLFEANSLTPGRAGVLLKNGDFVDGEFRGIGNGKVKVSSVLLGQRTYDLHPKVVAVLLRDAAVRTAPFEVVTRDGSVLRPRALAIEKETVRVDEPLAGRWQISFDELVEIRRSTRM